MTMDNDLPVVQEDVGIVGVDVMIRLQKVF